MVNALDRTELISVFFVGLALVWLATACWASRVGRVGTSRDARALICALLETARDVSGGAAMGFGILTTIQVIARVVPGPLGKQRFDFPTMRRVN